MWNDFGMGWGLGIFAVMHMVLWWALIGLGIVALVKWLAFGSASTDQRLGRHALDILGRALCAWRNGQGRVRAEATGSGEMTDLGNPAAGQRAAASRKFA